MFRSLLIASWTLLWGYVLWRVDSIPTISRRLPRRALVAGAALVWVAVVVYSMVGHGSSGRLGAASELIGMSGLTAMFLVAFCLLAVDLVTGFGLLAPRLAPRLRAHAVLAGLALTLIAAVQGLRPPVVRSYEVRLAGLPVAADGTTMVGLSDLHLGSLLGRRWLASRVAQVQALEPDLVVLLGDITEGHGGPPASELLPELRRLAAPLGVWAVTGNHESHHRGAQGARLLEDAGFHVLRDRRAEVRQGLVLVGLDHVESAGGVELGRALAGRPPAPTILLSHAPRLVDAAARAGVALMLCGHTHGGQVWPFSWVVGRVYPLLGGRYEVGGMTVIVCRGTGTWGPRMRLWRPAEIVCVRLRAGTAPASFGRNLEKSAIGAATECGR